MRAVARRAIVRRWRALQVLAVRHGARLVARFFSADRSSPNYLTAVVLMLLALGLRLGMAPVQAGLQYITFFPAVTLAAFFGGMRAGLLATVLGVVMATTIFTPPYYTLSMAVVQTSAWSNLVFLIDGCIVSWLITTMHRYRRHYQRELDAARQVAAQLADLNQQLRTAAVAFESNEAIMITDAAARIMQVNRAFERLTGYSAHEVLDKNPRMLASGRHDHAFYTAMWRELLESGTWTGEVWDRHKRGHLYPKQMTITAVHDEAGKVHRYVAIFSDITERKLAEEVIRNMAFCDPLTGLPNRRLLADRMGIALAAAERNRQWGALLCLDMDRFKSLNDTMGHHHGDLMLIDIARRLRGLVRESDTVARLGGDEFVVLIAPISSEADEASVKTAHLAEKIRDALTAPFRLGDYTHHGSASIGVCLYGGGGGVVEDLLRHADKALYEAKESGRNKVRFFDPQLQASVQAHALLESELGQAIEVRQLRLFLQPKVNRQRQIVGAEALLCWMHPNRGLLQPEDFMHVMDASPLLHRIGLWTLDAACRQLAAWQARHAAPGLTLAVNVHVRHFVMPGFRDQLAEVLASHGVAASALRLNVEEAAVAADLDDCLRTALALHETLGVGMVLDQFGLGRTSLPALRRLPVSQLKLPAAMALNLTDSGMAEVRALVGVAQQFGLPVLANGVDSPAQFHAFAQAGCQGFQGRLFGTPLVSQAFAALLAPEHPNLDQAST